MTVDIDKAMITVYDEAKKMAYFNPVIGMDNEDLVQELAQAGSTSIESWDPSGKAALRTWVRGVMNFRVGHLRQAQNRDNRKMGWTVRYYGSSSEMASASLEPQDYEAIFASLYGPKLNSVENGLLVALKEHGNISAAIDAVYEGGLGTPDELKKIYRTLLSKAGAVSDPNVMQSTEKFEDNISISIAEVVESEVERAVAEYIAQNGLSGTGNTKANIAERLGLTVASLNIAIKNLGKNQALREILAA